VSNIVNNAGNRVKGYDYDEYGNLTGSSGNFKNEVTYTGYVADNATGLYYANARYYNPSTGRFLTQDAYTGKAGEPWTQNLYSYCGNNPINFIDPTGHCRETPRMRRQIDCHSFCCPKSRSFTAKTISPEGSPVVMKQTGNAIHIDVHVKFSGKGIDKELLIKGIEEHWTGKYAQYTVYTNVIEGKSPSGSRLRINIKDEAGISNAGWKFTPSWTNWDGVYVGSVTLYPSYPGHPPYSDADLMKLVSHEIGHVFGLWGNVRPEGEDPDDTDTIMGSRAFWENVGVVTGVNIEKMLIAQKTGRPQ